MQDFFDEQHWGTGSDYVPQLFHRTDSFRLFDPRGRIAVHRATELQLVLGRVRSTGHDITLEEPDRLSLLFPWAGRITCSVRDAMMVAYAGGVLAFAPNRRRTVVAPPSRGVPFMADVLTLPMTVLREAQRSEDVRPGPISARRLADLYRIRQRIARMLTTDEAGHASFGGAHVAGEIAADLALAMSDPDRRPPSAGQRRVAQAIALMRAHFAEPLSIAKIAEELRCSRRSLQAGFQEMGHPNPQEMLAGIRLDAVRVMLLSGKQSVTECALTCGITHLGRFSQEYRRRYGENPQQTRGTRF
jgi:AraC-like DNA-binding protein